MRAEGLVRHLCYTRRHDSLLATISCRRGSAPHVVGGELVELIELISLLRLGRRALTLPRHERAAPTETRGVITGLPPRTTKTIIVSR